LCSQGSEQVGERTKLAPLVMREGGKGTDADKGKGGLTLKKRWGSARDMQKDHLRRDVGSKR